MMRQLRNPLSAIVIILLASSAVCKGQRSTVSPSDNVCLTPGCVKAASELLSLIDEDVDPCTDFYRFACGGWLKRSLIPEDKSRLSTWTKTQDEVELQLRSLLEEKKDESEPRFIRMAKDLYDTCMDLEKIERHGSKPLKAVLNTLGGWPVVEGRHWDDSNFDWVELLISLRKLGFGINILMSLYVAPDNRNNTVHIIELDEADLGMPDREYLLRGLNDPETEAYYKLMVKSAKELGADEAIADIELLKALHFEMALANFSLPHEERRNVSKLYNKYTVRELQEMIPQIPWLRFFNGLLDDEVHENETLIVAVPSFVKKFATLIKRTEKRVVANYMLWRVVYQSMRSLSKKWREIYHEFSSMITGTTQERPRWKQCLSLVSGSGFEIALGSAYVRRHFKEESKEAAEEMVDYIKREFLHILENIDWMDEKTMKEAKAKADTMTLLIGYPDELLNDTALLVFYENLTITTESHFLNARIVSKWLKDKAYSKLRKPNIKGDWENYADAAEVNAYYWPLDNIIVFPAGILQGIFYDKDRPNYMNFGAIGYIIGHEITHGFDDEGKQFDKDGNNVDWWDETTHEHFEKKAQCIIDQYSNYTAENGMKLNGVNTQGENIADNGGLKEAYWAYQSWVKDNGPEQLLPGIKYNQDQLFWLSAASSWCEKERPESLKLTILSDPHSPGEFRITGPMSNLEEFSKDFNCPTDSTMNKKHKCQVW